MGIYEELGLERIINASGAVTRLGGAPMPKEVLEAFRSAAGGTVPLEALQAVASRRIANVTRTESGLVTCGCAAALTLGAAAILTRDDFGRMERLPDCDGFPNEFVIAREQRSGYDHAVRASGAQLVEVGFNERVANAGVRRSEAWEYEAAFGPSTAGVVYVFAPHAQPPLAEVVAVAHRHQLPVLVDAAGELPPRSNLWEIPATGADLVCFSGGKAIQGPQSTGILCGRRELVAAAFLQMLDMDEHFDLWSPPSEFFDKEKLIGLPRHGIGRAMKVSKEQIVALLTALERFAAGNNEEERATQRRVLETIAAELALRAVACRIIASADNERPPHLEIQLDEAELGRSAFDVCRQLRAGSPPVYVGHGQLDEGTLVVHPLCVDAEDVPLLASRLRDELT